MPDPSCVGFKKEQQQIDVSHLSANTLMIQLFSSTTRVVFLKIGGLPLILSNKSWFKLSIYPRLTTIIIVEEEGEKRAETIGCKLSRPPHGKTPIVQQLLGTSNGLD